MVRRDHDWVADVQVRKVKQQSTRGTLGSHHQVVLDSGTDLSVMPRAWLAGCGSENQS